jgi:gentisate 1,2-dioxygenase
MEKTGAEAALQEFAKELEGLNVNFAAIKDQPLILPKTHKTVFHHWDGAALTRVLHKSLSFQDKLPTGQAGAERRIVRLQNPGLDEETVTNTMSMSLQLLMPGEVARPHRHTPVAFRFFLTGEAYTTVNGEKCVMHRGDLVLTPYMQWHDHGNESDAPAIWLDGLDFPLVRYLDAVIKQDTERSMQDTGRSGTTDRRFSAPGLRPAWIGEDQVERSSLIHYRWSHTIDALDALASAGDASATDDILLEYVNPATGQAVFSTIACYAQMIRPGVTTLRHRQTGNDVYHAFEGAGAIVVDGKRTDWKKGDFFVVPSLAWHHYENHGKDPAILFRLSDGPTFRRLNLWRSESDAPRAAGAA